MGIKHAFTSTKADGGDTSLLQPSYWNADHVGLTNADRLWVPGSNPYGLDDEFNDASIDPSWILVNPSPVRATWTEGHDVLSCYVTNGNGAGQYNAIVKSISGLTPPRTFETCYRYLTPYAYNYFMTGLILSDSATWGSGKAIDSQSYTNSSIAVSGAMRLHSQTVAYNSDSGNSVAHWQWTGSVIYHRLVWTSSTSYSMYISPDGVSWLTIATSYNPFTMSPTYAGLYTSTWAGGSPSIASFEYFRVY